MWIRVLPQCVSINTNIIAVAIGFIIGLLVMLALHALMEKISGGHGHGHGGDKKDEEHDHKHGKDEHEDKHSKKITKSKSTVGTLTNLYKDIELKSLRKSETTTKISLIESHPHDDHIEISKGRIPWTTIMPILIDITLDGLVLGITTSSHYEGGLMLGIGTGVEVFFVGLTLCITLNAKNINKLCSQMIGIFLSLSIVIGAVVGVSAGAALQESVVYGGIMGFAVVALAWLTIEELLKESHEGSEHESWMVTGAFFFGILMMIVLDKFTG